MIKLYVIFVVTVVLWIGPWLSLLPTNATLIINQLMR